MDYLNQSTNQNDGLAGRCQGLFPPQRPGDEVAELIAGWDRKNKMESPLAPAHQVRDKCQLFGADVHRK